MENYMKALNRAIEEGYTFNSTDRFIDVIRGALDYLVANCPPDREEKFPLNFLSYENYPHTIEDGKVYIDSIVDNDAKVVRVYIDKN